MPVKIYKLTAAIAAHIITRKRQREKACYSSSAFNIKRFIEHHKNDVVPVDVVCYSCRHVITIGSQCVSRVHRSSNSRMVHYHLNCARKKNIL